jgi:hypothetical protein
MGQILTASGGSVFVPLYRSNVSTSRVQISEAVTGVPAAGGESIEFVSSDAADAAAGTGAQELTVAYLDDTGALQTEAKATNGTTVVASTASDIWRILGAWVSAVGSGLKNAGAISIRHTSDTPVYAKILAGENMLAPGAYTVPVGKVARFMGGRLWADEDTDLLTAYLMAEIDPSDGSYTAGVFQTLLTIPFRKTIEIPPINVDEPGPFELPALATIKVEAEADALGSHPIGGMLQLAVS